MKHHCINLTELNLLENDLSLSGGGNTKLWLILKITTENLIVTLKKMSFIQPNVIHDHVFLTSALLSQTILCKVWDRECLLLCICKST